MSGFNRGGFGMGRGIGRGRNSFGNGGGGGFGSSGNCVCLKCGYVAPKERGVPCQEIKCPNCGVRLVREGGYHHNLSLQKKNRSGDDSNG